MRALKSVPSLCGVALCLALAACGGGSSSDGMSTDAAAAAQAAAAQPEPSGQVAASNPLIQIKVLSNRADLVSGGDALVELVLPQGRTTNGLLVYVGSRNVTSAFSTGANGRTLGLVTGLNNGPNVLRAKHLLGGNGQLTITNHPIGGPVLLSTQTQPWICATPVPTAGNATTPATNASGLSTNAVDAQCNVATETKFFYRTLTPVSVTAGDGGCSFVVPDPSPTITNPNPTTPANSCLQPYVVGATPAASVASTTTSNGLTVPYIVRRERGTINRGIYDIAVLFDPTKPWTANSPQPQWNGKISYTYGASAGQPRLQFRSEQNWVVNGISGVEDDSALRMGYIVVDNSLTDQLYNANAILAAETTMMMKEYIIDHYGEIKFTQANGCSGGSILQNSVASVYPGLLDGIQVTCDYPDSVTTLLEVADCELLVNAYQSPQWLALQTGLTQAQINAKKAVVNGHLDQLGCQSWNNSFAFINQPGNYVPLLVVDQNTGALAPTGAPRNNCMLPASQVYDPVTNPTGTRCGQPDLSVAIWGTTANTAPGVPAGTQRAVEPYDNIGIQYGLKALLAGTISPEEFVTLNEQVGGLDADSNRMAARSAADPAALDIAYRSGLVGSGKQLGKVAIIDWRGYDEQGIHYIWRSFSERARIDAAYGDHNNQVMWRFGTGLTPPLQSGIMQMSLSVMDTWLTNLVTAAPKTLPNDEHSHTQVVAAKPASAFDFCYLTSDTTFSNKITDFATCDTDPHLKANASPRQVAGGPLAENIMKCQLKPLNFGDYTGVTFTTAQQTRLNAVFPNGVCDWSKPGVSQQDAQTPLTYAAGPGGAPLPPPPTSVPIGG
jgi:uncharacterized tannase-like protein DUF6351